MNSKILKLGCLGAVLVLCSVRAQALDGAVLIANSSVTADSLSAGSLKNIYTGKTKYWDGGQAIIIAVLPDETDAALEQASGLDPSSFRTFWQRLVFSGRGQEPQKAFDAAALVALVASTKGAIALVPANAILTGVKIIEVK
jgi:ABC-type phosphate transport system substrate-binding protein